MDGLVKTSHVSALAHYGPVIARIRRCQCSRDLTKLNSLALAQRAPEEKHPWVKPHERLSLIAPLAEIRPRPPPPANLVSHSQNREPPQRSCPPLSSVDFARRGIIPQMLWGVALEGYETKDIRRVGGLCPVAVEKVLLAVVPALEVYLAVLCGEEEFKGDSEDALFGFRP